MTKSDDTQEKLNHLLGKMDKVEEDKKVAIETAKEKRERIERQDKQRDFNTKAISFLTIAMLVMIFVWMFKGKDIRDEYNLQTEIENIVSDENLRLKKYKDSLGKWTIGYGHLIKEGEQLDEITHKKARELLYADYIKGRESVDKNYPWAKGEVRLVLINMTFQLGERGVSKFKKALKHLEAGEYGLASDEMLDSRWWGQTPHRAQRQAARIMNLDRSLW